MIYYIFEKGLNYSLGMYESFLDAATNIPLTRAFVHIYTFNTN